MDDPRMEKDPMPGICVECHEKLEQTFAGEGSGASEKESFLENHLVTCEECRRFKGVLELFQDAPKVSDDFVSDVVLAHMNSRPEKAGIFRFGLKFAAVAAVVASALAVGIFVERGRDTTTQSSVATIPLTLVSGRAEIGGKVAKEGANISEGAHLKTVEQPTLVASGSSLSFGLAKESDVDVVAARRDSVRLHLRNGTCAVSLEPARNISLDVQVGDLRIDVTGTIFGVQSHPRPSVHVVRGSVVASSRGQTTEPIEVVAGRAYFFGEESDAPLDPQMKDEILRLLHASEETREPTDDFGNGPENEPVPSANKMDENGQVDDNRPIEPALPRQATRKHGGGVKALSSRHPPQGSPVGSDGVTPNTYIRAARECRRQRDWKCAAEAYRKVRELYPAHPMANTVMVPLAQIELKYLGNPRQSYRLYSEYLRVEPRGPLSQEALYGKCRALGEMGEKEKEAKAIGQFLTRYPRSAYAPNARNRLQELQENRK